LPIYGLILVPGSCSGAESKLRTRTLIVLCI
jgi:hypothetical protein